jgi:hypothetical protein
LKRLKIFTKLIFSSSLSAFLSNRPNAKPVQDEEEEEEDEVYGE